MAITYVAAGAAATGNNASVAPALPAGWAAGDLLLVLASIRNSGTGTVTTPTGWTALASSGNVSLLGRIAQVGDTAPTIAYAGGVAGADTIAQCTAWRGTLQTATASLLHGDAATQLNASAANIAYPALGVTLDGCLIIRAGWKQDDWTSVATIAGMTEIAETATTTGDDAGQVWDYTIQTTATATTSGSFTVTGGVSAISRGLVVAIRPAVAITATEQDAWPVRMLVTATGLDAGDLVDVDRVEGATRTAVRGGDQVTASDPSLVLVDAELPFGTAVSYTLTVDGVDLATTATASHTLVGGKVAVTDAIEGSAAEVVILAWPDRSRSRVASSYVVGGRTVVVSGPLGDPTGQVELWTDTDVGRTTLLAVLSGATSGVVQLRQAGAYPGVDHYCAVTEVREARASQDGTDPRRRWVLTIAEVQPWADTYTARGSTLADVDAAYTGLTLADLAGDYTTLLAVAQHDWSQ
jgi:hypothetical protein